MQKIKAKNVRSHHQNQSFIDLVVMDSRKKIQYGKALRIGRLDNANKSLLMFDQEKTKELLFHGVQLTKRVKSIIKKYASQFVAENKKYFS